tara:strand:- start:277 stop:894 length:618 start_codon:yes stop_codon:yes gene_type:complete
MSDHFSQLEPAIKILETLIKKYKNHKNVEIEIKLGRIDGSFVAGIHSESFYDKIKQTLNSYKGWNSVIEENTIDYIKDSYRKTGDIIIYKKRLETFNFMFKGTPYDFRICVSTETSCTLASFKHSLVRKKNRISYIYEECKLDLTKIEEETNDEIIENEEFEVELIKLNSSTSDVYRAHSALLKIRDIINICEQINDKSEIIKVV